MAKRIAYSKPVISVVAHADVLNTEWIFDKGSRVAAIARIKAVRDIPNFPYLRRLVVETPACRDWLIVKLKEEGLWYADPEENA
jgi:hypothetical protein